MKNKSREKGRRLKIFKYIEGHYTITSIHGNFQFGIGRFEGELRVIMIKDNVLYYQKDTAWVKANNKTMQKGVTEKQTNKIAEDLIKELEIFNKRERVYIITLIGYVVFFLGMCALILLKL